MDTNSLREVDSAANLPECNIDNEGVKYWINNATEVRICKNEEWQILRSSDIDPDTIFVRDTIFEKDTIKVSSCNGEDFDKKKAFAMPIAFYQFATAITIAKSKKAQMASSILAAINNGTTQHPSKQLST